MSQTVLVNGKITTLDPARPEASALTITQGVIESVGTDPEILSMKAKDATVIDLCGHRVIPGLNDSHIHLIRGGLNYNMELRWEGVPSLADALRLLQEQAARTPPPQWVRVVGGWSEFQFVERRMPTLDEINKVAPDTPVFVLHLYGRALLNKAAVRAVGYDEKTPNPPGGEIQRDASGRPTGLLLAKPNALILYSALAKGPRLSFDDQMNSTRHFMRELNRLGITSVIDAGGGKQNYPEDYQVIQKLHQADLLTLRIAYNLFAQQPGEEFNDYERWLSMTEPGAGDAFFRMNGAGENLTWSAADFEDFLEPRPDLVPAMEGELERIVRLLAEHQWPFRIHATYNESIQRFLEIFERVDRDIPFQGTRFIIDHAETITPRNIERIKRLGGGIAIQDRMAFQGEYFVARYGQQAAQQTPPIAKMLELGVPVGAGTDATRVASYNPWVALQWLITGKTLGGLTLTPQKLTLDRQTALRLYTHGSAWFSGEEKRKGLLSPGMYGDLAVLSMDYLSVPEEQIQRITSLLTLVGGRVVHGSGAFKEYDPPMPLPSPDWSPVRAYGGISDPKRADRNALQRAGCGCTPLCHVHHHRHPPVTATSLPSGDPSGFWGGLGCSCFAF